MQENKHQEKPLEPRDFERVIHEIEESTRQGTIISDAFFAFCKILLPIAAASFLILASLEIWRLGYSVVFPVLGSALALVCLVFAYKQFTTSNDKVTSKDRICYLKCIQAAQSVDELDRLGFFRVPPCRTGEDYRKDRANLAQKMIKTFSRRS